MREVHCYGQTPEMQTKIDLFYESRGHVQEAALQLSFSGAVYDADDPKVRTEKPEYDRYEEGRDWQPTVCGLRAASADVLRPSDFVSVVNHTNPAVDMDSYDGEWEASPYQDGDLIPNAKACEPCKEVAPRSWPFLFYAGTEEDSQSPLTDYSS